MIRIEIDPPGANVLIARWTGHKPGGIPAEDILFNDKADFGLVEFCEGPRDPWYSWYFIRVRNSYKYGLSYKTIEKVVGDLPDRIVMEKRIGQCH